jgi:hypothetical protein
MPQGGNNMRPIYETTTNLKLERNVGIRLQEIWDCTAVKLPIAYGVDYALVRYGDIHAWAEIKCRNNPSGQYDTFMLSLNKWMKGKELAREALNMFIVVVAYTDKIVYLKVDDSIVPEIGIKGRTDRGDWQDQEPCVFIKRELFKEL